MSKPKNLKDMSEAMKEEFDYLRKDKTRVKQVDALANIFGKEIHRVQLNLEVEVMLRKHKSFPSMEKLEAM